MPRERPKEIAKKKGKKIKKIKEGSFAQVMRELRDQRKTKVIETSSKEGL